MLLLVTQQSNLELLSFQNEHHVLCLGRGQGTGASEALGPAAKLRDRPLSAEDEADSGCQRICWDHAPSLCPPTPSSLGDGRDSGLGCAPREGSGCCSGPAGQSPVSGKASAGPRTRSTARGAPMTAASPERRGAGQSPGPAGRHAPLLAASRSPATHPAPATSARGAGARAGMDPAAIAAPARSPVVCSARPAVAPSRTCRPS